MNVNDEYISRVQLNTTNTFRVHSSTPLIYWVFLTNLNKGTSIYKVSYTNLTGSVYTEVMRFDNKDEAISPMVWTSMVTSTDEC
jgi:phenolic acid decarboxylase